MPSTATGSPVPAIGLPLSGGVVVAGPARSTLAGPLTRWSTPLAVAVHGRPGDGVEQLCRAGICRWDDPGTDRIRYEILDPERDRAGALLTSRGLAEPPVPETGDLFFDVEGARYYSEDGANWPTTAETPAPPGAILLA